MAHKYALPDTTNFSKNLFVMHAQVQLSDGSFAFLVYTGTGGIELWHSPNHTSAVKLGTLSTVNNSGVSNFTAFDMSTNQVAPNNFNSRFALVRDNVDNIYVLGRGAGGASTKQYVAAQCWVKGTGNTWAAGPFHHGASYFDYNVVKIAADWCNTGGGYGNLGHIMLVVELAATSTDVIQGYAVVDAGLVAYGRTDILAHTARGHGPTFTGNPYLTRYTTGLEDALQVSCDLPGVPHGLACGGATKSGNDVASVWVGFWGVDSAGKLNYNSFLGTVVSSLGASEVSYLVLVEYNHWVLLVRDGSGRIRATGWTVSGYKTGSSVLAPAGVVDYPDVAATATWGGAVDNGTKKVWVFKWSATTPTTLRRLGLTSPATGPIVWDAAAVTDDTAVGPAGGSHTSTRYITDPVGTLMDYLSQHQNGTVQTLVGNNSPFNKAPLAPTLLGPTDGEWTPLAATPTFSWRHNDSPGDAQTAYAFRRRVGAGAYEYWNSGTAAWQPTEVWNNTATQSVTFPAGKWANGTTYTWSVRTRDSYSFDGVYPATDFTVTGSAPPTATVTGPADQDAGVAGNQLTNTTIPTVAWTYADPEGAAQSAWHVRVFESAIYSAAGFDPATTTGAAADSGRVTGTAASWQVDRPLENNKTYRAYVMVWQVAGSGTQPAASWSFREFATVIPPMTVPTMAILIQASQGRVRATLTNPDANPGEAELQASDDGVSWTTITRGLVLAGATIELYDISYKPRAPRHYRARTTKTISGGTVPSAWTATTSLASPYVVHTSWWLKLPGDHTRNIALEVENDVLPIRYPRETAVFAPLSPAGAKTNKIVLYGSRRGAEIATDLWFDSQATWDAFMTLLDEGKTLLLQGDTPDLHWYVRYGDDINADLRNTADRPTRPIRQGRQLWIEVNP